MTNRAALVVDVQVACSNPDIPANTHIEEWIGRAIDAAGSEMAAGAEVSVRLVDKEEIQALNRDFRGIDRPTNVLSFPAGETTGLPLDVVRPLGDIVICAAVVNDEAARQGKPSADHWAHMLVHGTLHLLGYDHESDAEAAEMEAEETRILGAAGLADPYL